ncbi:MAG: UDP-3-O-(3-hydroxymyristoyl)glucosamine N-acyltransferase [Terriglobia bacterium]
MSEWTAGSLAARLELPLRGDGARPILGAAALGPAGPLDLAFVGSEKLFAAARDSKAGCLIALPEYQPGAAQTVISSSQPRAHFAQALALLYPARPVRAGIHPTADIAEDAFVDQSAEIGAFVSVGSGSRVGARTRIGEGSSLGRQVTVGDECVFHPRVTIYDRVSLGSRCIVHSGAVIGADGFGFEMQGGAYRKVPQVGVVNVGSDVEIGANTCIDRATLGATVIGDGTKLDNMVHIAHNCGIGRHVVIAAQTGLAGGVTVGDYAIVGGQVGVGDKARIEARSIVGSGAGILTSKIVRAGEPVWGTPARPLRQYLAQLATLSRLTKKSAADKNKSPQT